MKKLISIIMVIGLLVFSSIAFAAEQSDNIKALCLDEWGDDYQMAQYCFNSQIKAFTLVIVYFDAHLKKYSGVKGGSALCAEYESDAKAKIVMMCHDKWKAEDFDTWDFVMVNHCIETQMFAYKTMKN